MVLVNVVDIFSISRNYKIWNAVNLDSDFETRFHLPLLRSKREKHSFQKHNLFRQKKKKAIEVS